MYLISDFWICPCAVSGRIDHESGGLCVADRLEYCIVLQWEKDCKILLISWNIMSNFVLELCCRLQLHLLNTDMVSKCSICYRNVSLESSWIMVIFFFFWYFSILFSILYYSPFQQQQKMFYICRIKRFIYLSPAPCSTVLQCQPDTDGNKETLKDI